MLAEVQESLVVFLLALAIWGFCRAYYFAFYVIEHYADPDYRFSGLSARSIGVDPDRIVASGGSAGGHIAACTAFTSGLDADDEDAKISSKPNALVLFNPVLRFTGIPQLMERIGGDEALGKAMSPTLHLTKDSPPTLIFFGTADRLATMGDEFMNKSKELEHRAQLFTAEGQPHGFFNRSPWQEKTTLRMDEFLVSIGYLPSGEQ